MSMDSLVTKPDVDTQRLKPEPVEDNDFPRIAKILAREFMPTTEEGVRKFNEYLRNPSTRGYVLKEGKEGIIGVATYTVYPYEEIAPQLYLVPEIDNGSVRTLRLERFSALVKSNFPLLDPKKVSELGYIWIDQRRRGERLGSLLNRRLMEELGSIPNSLMFTLARSTWAGTGLGNKILEFLLMHERQSQGLEKSDYVPIRSVRVPIEEFHKIGLDLRDISPKAGAPKTIHFCDSYGFKFTGFGRNLSPLYMKVASS